MVRVSPTIFLRDIFGRQRMLCYDIELLIGRNVCGKQGGRQAGRQEGREGGRESIYVHFVLVYRVLQTTVLMS